MRATAPDDRFGSANPALEVVLVKIARTLYDYIDVQEDAEAIRDIDPLLGQFQRAANDYVNRTDHLHPDLGLELREWASFKRTLLEQKPNDKSSIDRPFVDNYGKTPEEIISNLEQELGIQSAKPNTHKR